MRREYGQGATRSPWRLSMRWLMLSIVVASLGLAAFVTRSPGWAGAVLLATVGTLLLGVVGAVCRTGRRRVWWLGFTLFGGTYFFLLSSHEWSLDKLLGEHANLHIDMMRWDLPTRKLIDFSNRFAIDADGENDDFRPSYEEIAECLATLCMALLGGALARVFFGGPAFRDAAVRGTETVVPRRPARRVRLVVALAGYAVLGCVLLIGVDIWPAVSPGLAVVGTWALIGLAAVGAVCSAGRRRAAFLGAALFGAGFLAFLSVRDPYYTNWPRKAADALLTAARDTVGPARVSDRQAAGDNARIWKALEERIPMRFAHRARLPEVLRYIREKTPYPGEGRIPVYLDGEAYLHAYHDQSEPTVELELEGVPLKTSLRLLLAQLSMKYRIEDGVLYITSYESDFVNSPEDPFIEMGHCFFALVAVGVGAVVAPLVCGKQAEEGI